MKNALRLALVGAVGLAVACGDELINEIETEATSCGEGTTSNDAGVCVADAPPIECGEGAAVVNGECVRVSGAAVTTCGTGTTEMDGQCVRNDPLACGEGTFEHEGACVAFDPADEEPPTTTADPAGGELPDDSFVVLSTDEPATIYYTLDGSAPDTNSRNSASPLQVRITGLAGGDVTLSFFAVDAAGNAEEAQSETYSLDAPPPPVSDLAVALDGSDANITWSNPDVVDFAGVIVVRMVGGGAGSPVRGATYEEGDTLPDGGEVIYAGSDEEATDTNVAVGLASYAVFVVDVWGNYSPYRTASAVRDLPAQTGTIEIDLGSLDVTVGEQPDDLDITPIDDATWAGVGNPLTFEISVRNDTARVLWNLKALVEGINDVAVTVSNEDGTFDGKDYFFFGDPVPAIDVGKKQRITVTLDGVTGTEDPLTIDLSFVVHAMLFGSGDYYDGQLYAEDSSGTGESYEIDFNKFGGAGHNSSSSGYSNPMRGVASPDGRHLYYGVRNQPTIAIVDTANMYAWEAWDLTGQDNIRHRGDGSGSFGFTRGVEMSPDAKYLYVTLMTGEHNYECSSNNNVSGGASIELVKLDRVTLEEVGRVVLLSDIGEAQGDVVKLSADGSRGVVAIRTYGTSYGIPAHVVQAKIFVLDTDAMQIIDGNPAPGDQQAPIDLLDEGQDLRAAAISPDGETVYAHITDATDPHALRVVDLATGDVTIEEPPTFTAGSYTTELVFGPDGRLYWTTYDDLRVYDPGEDAWFEYDNGYTYMGVVFPADGESYYAMTTGSVAEHFDISDDSLIVSPASGALTIDLTDIDDAHAELITPY